MSVFVTNLLLLLFLVFLMVLVIMTRRLFAVVVLAGAYSLVSAAMFVNLDAVDVAFTEAAVGPAFPLFCFWPQWPICRDAKRCCLRPDELAMRWQPASSASSPARFWSRLPLNCRR